MFRQSIVVVRAPALVEESGSAAAQRDWGNAVRTPYGQCNVQPRVTAETEGATGISTAAEWVLHRRGILDLLPTDRVEYDGMTLEVIGVAKKWPRSSGGWHHTEAILSVQSLFAGSSGVDAITAARNAASGGASRKWSPV
ncbi:hypothetical protein [Kineosporia succinea]|uniref:Uncharacterized protein n=1 Tax=Kineosporia succinea TaxID=84632 RepID=A0ABT9PA79_9ACTN|nr:hypothetical protein [Kineosporia succinea]MDP9829456.1 hypothetical protein [Kineosporia succinea]